MAFNLAQCGQGSSDDELSPTVVSSLLGIGIGGVAAGLWHTVCISVDGRVYAFGGNQFGQLGTGNNQAEVPLLPLEGYIYSLWQFDLFKSLTNWFL